MFSSFAEAIQFLMEPTNRSVLISKGHSTINSANEYELDVLNTFLCDAGSKPQNFTKNV